MTPRIPPLYQKKVPKTLECLLPNPSNAMDTLILSIYYDAKIFENHRNPVMLVFFG